jgi:hypothetical protein
MTTRIRLGVTTVGVLLSAFSGAACGPVIDFNDRELQSPPETPAEEMPPRTCVAVVTEATPAYEAMCRHYCGELEATLSYAGHAEAAGAASESCYELRCAPRCVSRETCVSQCHAVGVHYQALCADAESAPDTVCPVSVQDRVDACLVGCGVPVAPPDPATPPDVPPADVPPPEVAGSKDEGGRQAT